MCSYATPPRPGAGTGSAAGATAAARMRGAPVSNLLFSV